MTKTSVVFLAVLLSGPGYAKGLAPDRIFKKASPSVVQIHVPFGVGKTAIGSGVIIQRPGVGKVVVTNCHVLEQALSGDISVMTSGKQGFKANLYAEDRKKDICLLRSHQSISAPAVMIAPLSSVAIGNRVYAIGAPQGLELSLSEGLISGFRTFDGTRMIQTTAAISRGSSGGGLFDDRGNLIGITTMYLDEGQALNFAIPAEQAGHVAVIDKTPGTDSVKAQKASAPPPAVSTGKKWTSIEKDDKAQVWVDLRSIETQGDKISFWGKSTSVEPMEIIEGKPFHELVAYYTVSCPTATWWINQYSLHAKTGQVVESGKIDEKDRTIHQFYPGTMGYRLFQQICR